MRHARLALTIAAAAAGCHLIGDFSHLRIREDGDAGGGGAGGGCPDACAELGLSCGEVVDPCLEALVDCDTAEKDGSETDVDCGGDMAGCPTRCAPGARCLAASDCDSGVCLAGVCQAAMCGDGVLNGGEACEDGGTSSYDGCSAACAIEDGHLLISELVVDDDAAEYIELHNASDATAGLSSYYIANYPGYHEHTQGVPPDGPGFLLGFPPDAIIAARGFVVISLETATAFATAHGIAPDYDMEGIDVPAMTGADVAEKLDNGSGMVVLFRWDGQSELVTDVDYLVYGNTSAAMDKSGVSVSGQSYADETPAAMQRPSPAPPKGRSLFRCDTVESTEIAAGGNGEDGHDETSEDLGFAFRLTADVTPSAAPLASDRGPCR